MVPLGTPLLAGPGVIIATIVFVGQAHGVSEIGAIYLGIVITLAIVFLALRFAGILNRLVRPAGVLLLSRGGHPAGGDRRPDDRRLDDRVRPSGLMPTDRRRRRVRGRS
ncbi:MAG: MarC family protein [Ilumatobacteraceae bacterium]